MNEEYYKELDVLLTDIQNELDYQKYLTPINFESENKKFIDRYNENEEYNPQYIYNKFDNSFALETYLKLKEKFVFDGTEIGRIYKKFISNLYLEIIMYSNIGNDNFSKISAELYGNPDRKYYESALKVLNEKPSEFDLDETYGPEKIAEIFRQRIAYYDFKWNIDITPNMAARVSVEPEQKTVYINKNKLFSRNDSIRLQVHEIDTHILRTENGYLRGSLPLALGTAQYMIHEEGLALYNEYKNNVMDPFSNILYAARFVTGVNISNTFFDLYDMLKKYGCSDFVAMYVVSRFKRGLSDTSHDGGFIKDYMYFQGFQEVKQAVEEDESIYKKMYFGSIGLSDIEILDNAITNAIEEKNIILPISEKYIEC